ncbi:nucleoporin NUP42 [Candoia aspera]|uniref:nucleoporin NUP42 n=1 Tax=Candoia aspera TaxID=51853 RepID=UPI002FD83429
MARKSGSVCSYFLQGNCRYGDRCWHEHPRGGKSTQAFGQNSGSSRRGAWSGQRQHSSSVQTSSFSKSSNRQSNKDPRFLNFSQNRFAALDSSENVNNDIKNEEEKLLEIIMKDMEIWESSGQWMFSTYSPMKEKPISGFHDFLPEELRLEYYNCRANNNIQNYINSVQQLVTQWRSRLLELKNLTASTKTALITELKNLASHQSPPFGFGGQQTSSRTSNFPVDKQNNVQAFSFKSPSEHATVSPRSTPIFGRLTNVQGAIFSSAAPHTVGFSNPPVSLGDSFSFKMATTSDGIGTPGFSGFGKPFSANSSPDITSATVFGKAVAPPDFDSANMPFGESANSLASNGVMISPVIPTSSTSEVLFTPKTELSAEELNQFEAKKFTLGKIPLKPPPVELLSM